MAPPNIFADIDRVMELLPSKTIGVTNLIEQKDDKGKWTVFANEILERTK
jgi:hypothetical protein